MSRVKIRNIFIIICVLILCLFILGNTMNKVSIQYYSLKDQAIVFIERILKSDSLKNTYTSLLELSGRKYINGQIKLSSGSLNHYLTPGVKELTDNNNYIQNADQILKLKNLLDEKGIPLLFVRAPDKIKEGSDELPKHAKSNIITNANKLVNSLKTNNINVLDLREKMDNENIDYNKAFFKTDHHWTAETALWATYSICEILCYDYGFNIDLESVNKVNYEAKTLRDSFIGSSGRLTSKAFGGKDDLTYFTPKFAMKFNASNKVKAEINLLFNLTYKIRKTINETLNRSKSHYEIYFDSENKNFNDTFIYQLEELYESDEKAASNYDMLNRYSGSIGYNFNNLSTDNDNKILFISDSFGNAIIPYLSNAVKSIDYVYITPNNDAVNELIEKNSYDFAILLTYDYVINENSRIKF